MNFDKKKATRESYGEALVELGKKNEKVVVFDAYYTQFSFLYSKMI